MDRGIPNHQIEVSATYTARPSSRISAGHRRSRQGGQERLRQNYEPRENKSSAMREWTMKTTAVPVSHLQLPSRTAWPDGPIAVIVAAVVCSLLASLEQPDKVSMAAAATVLLAAVPVLANQFYLMPLPFAFP